MNNADMPAMPQILEQALHMADGSVIRVIPVEFSDGLTKREQFCLQMGVPETGDPELDEIIRKGERKRIAAMSMQGLITLKGSDCMDKDTTAKQCVAMEDALLKELEK